MTHTAQPHSPDAPARRGRRRLTAALLASLLLHAVLLALVSTTPGTSGQPGQALPTLQLQLAISPTPAPTSTAVPPLPSAPTPPLPAAASPIGTPAPPPPFDPERYLPLAALDLKPLVQREPTALLPGDAAPGQSGTLILEIFLNASGGIDRITVIETTPTDLPASWRNAAISGFAGATFSPGWKDGQAVPSRLRLEISHQPAP